MAAYAVISAMGPDRVGIVDDLSAEAEAIGCSIEESRMAVLGGEFAVIMLISGEEDQISTFIEKSPDLGKKVGLHIEAKPTVPSEDRTAGLPYMIETSAMDTPGIVHAVTQVIRPLGISIEDCETDTSAAPWTGSPLFHMRARVIVPAGVSIAELKDRLADLENERDMDINLRSVSSTWDDT